MPPRQLQAPCGRTCVLAQLRAWKRGRRVPPLFRVPRSRLDVQRGIAGDQIVQLACYQRGRSSECAVVVGPESRMAA